MPTEIECSFLESSKILRKGSDWPLTGSCGHTGANHCCQKHRTLWGPAQGACPLLGPLPRGHGLAASPDKGETISGRNRCHQTKRCLHDHYTEYNIFKNKGSPTRNLLTEHKQCADSETLYNQAGVRISWESSSGPRQHTERQFARPVCSVTNVTCFSSVLSLHMSISNWPLVSSQRLYLLSGCTK